MMALWEAEWEEEGALGIRNSVQKKMAGVCNLCDVN